MFMRYTKVLRESIELALSEGKTKDEAKEFARKNLIKEGLLLEGEEFNPKISIKDVDDGIL